VDTSSTALASPATQLARSQEPGTGPEQTAAPAALRAEATRPAQP